VALVLGIERPETPPASFAASRCARLWHLTDRAPRFVNTAWTGAPLNGREPEDSGAELGRPDCGVADAAHVPIGYIASLAVEELLLHGPA